MQTKYNERLSRARKANARFLQRATSEVGASVLPSSPTLQRRLSIAEDEILSDGIVALQEEIATLEREVQERLGKHGWSRAKNKVVHKLRFQKAVESAAVTRTLAGTDWQAVPAADGKSYYWNTKSNEVSWDPPWARSDWIASSSSQRQQNGDAAAAASSSSSSHSPSKSPKARSPSKRPKRVWKRPAPVVATPANGEEADITTGAGLSYAGGGRHDVASLIFKKHDSDGDGILSVAELAKLCASMDRPLEDKRVELLRSILDADGDGLLTRDEFLSWWREGEAKRWALFESTEHEARVRGLSEFFTAFGPSNGKLDGEKLLRMHLCLRDRGHTKKALFDFMKDVDEEGDGYVTLHKLHRWWFREKSLSPPKPPTIGERRRPVWEEARADMLEENAMRQRNVTGMKARAGRKI